MGRSSRYSGADETDESGSGSGSEAATAGGRTKRQLCRSRNAQLARENRIRKKKYLAALEKNLAQLKHENKELRRLLGEQANCLTELREDGRYLRAALANSKPLATLLRRLQTGSASPPTQYLTPVVDNEPLPSPLLPSPTLDPDHTYTHMPEQNLEEPLADVGMCLHVSSNRMSLEFCSICNERAVRNYDFVDISALCD